MDFTKALPHFRMSRVPTKDFTRVVGFDLMPSLFTLSLPESAHFPVAKFKIYRAKHRSYKSFLDSSTTWNISSTQTSLLHYSASYRSIFSFRANLSIIRHVQGHYNFRRHR